MARADFIRTLAAQEVRRRQTSEEAWWFGSGPKAGAVPASDMRVAAQSTRDADAADIEAFHFVYAGTPRRSIYQRLTLPPRATTVGFVEIAFAAAECKEIAAWVQVSLYSETGGLPADLLGRCVPIPLPVIPQTTANTDTYLIPLWTPVQLQANAIVWMGISPKAYSAPGAPSYSSTSTKTTLFARGNRVDTGVSDFIEARHPDVEPPLTDYTSLDDEHLWVRLYEDAEALVKAARIGAAAPANAVGVRSVMDRPVGGRVESRYQAEIRPGHATAPWNVGAQAMTGGGGLGGLNIQRTRVALVAGQADYELPWTPLSVLSIAVRNLSPVYGLDYTITAASLQLLGSWVPQESEGWIEVVAII